MIHDKSRSRKCPENFHIHLELEGSLLGGLRDEASQDLLQDGLLGFDEGNSDKQVVGRLKFYARHIQLRQESISTIVTLGSVPVFVPDRVRSQCLKTS